MTFWLPCRPRDAIHRPCDALFRTIRGIRPRNSGNVLEMSAKNRPTDIKLHQKSRKLELTFDDGSRFELPCEYLRVYSPSAEVRGHGPGQEVLQLGKEKVNIAAIEPVGAYAVA